MALYAARKIARMLERGRLEMWRRKMQGHGRDQDITRAMLLQGAPWSALDRRAGRRKGWPDRELKAGLSLFCELWFGQTRETELDMSV